MLASTGRRIASSSTTLVKRLSSDDLAGLTSAAVKHCAGGPGTAARALSAAADSLDIKAVLEQKIPVEQVRSWKGGKEAGGRSARGPCAFFEGVSSRPSTHECVLPTEARRQHPHPLPPPHTPRRHA